MQAARDCEVILNFRDCTLLLIVHTGDTSENTVVLFNLFLFILLNKMFNFKFWIIQ